MSVERLIIRVNGIVQGVGFRPFVYRLAKDLTLGGYVNNSNDGVMIEVEGARIDIESFKNRLLRNAPPLSRIVDFETEAAQPRGETDFVIKTSEHDRLSTTLIPPDIAICDDCLNELFDPADRRYSYPFINCTNCGPRYTIVEGIPYDRQKTSMGAFLMCEKCQAEYDDPANRRFHAQPNACPVCGPKLTLYGPNGIIDSADPVAEVTRYLHEGKIVAVRGLGGFHLAVDARNDDAIGELRIRKGRAEKPFALMAPDIGSIRKFCEVSPGEEELLNHYTRPIVLLKAIPDSGLAPSVAPENIYFGFMLAYSPLHHLLLKGNFDALIMTSGNYSEEPIAIGVDEALDRLAPLADYVLVHDREILQRCDDSIARHISGKSRIIRRARGYVPRPIFLKKPVEHNILACGAELKNTIALSRGKTVFLSQHIGDLDNPSAYAFFEHAIEHLGGILEIKPEAIACDLHPEYLSTKWARSRNGVPLIAVQHHHAHLASVMAENGLYRPIIGIILDGTGYGTDGTIWGGEILIGDASEFDRFAYLQPTPLPGGNTAIVNPWRMAVSYLYQAYGKDFKHLNLPFLKTINGGDIELIIEMIDKKINSPMTSSCGRLFDGVSSMLGIRQTVNFEAQAAMGLEMIIDENDSDLYQGAICHACVSDAIPITPLIKSVVSDIIKGTPIEAISSRFHRTLAEMFIMAASKAREMTWINDVGLSGGVFQNAYFFKYILDRLRADGFDVFTHSEVPTNDGGIALGQVMVADEFLKGKNIAR